MKELEEVRLEYSQDVVWHALRVLLPPGPELERRARTTGAFRRKRGVREAADLLRVALSYAFCDLSFDATSAWARANESAELCKQAVIRRLRGCGEWLEGLLAEKLASRLPTVELGGLRLRLVDATRVTTPGSKGDAWRVHVCYDPLTGRLCEVFITDALGGERLSRFTVRPGELFVGDRAYGTRPGIAHIVGSGGQFLVRASWKHAPLECTDGRPFDLFATLRGLGEGEAGDLDIRVAADERHGIEAHPCRLVAIRKPVEVAEAAKKRILTEAKKKRRTVDPRSLEACEYFFVLTSLCREQFDSSAVLSLYGLRWQVEVEFKCLKSLMRLDELRARHPGTIRATLAAKMLGAVLVQELAGQSKGQIRHWTWLQVLYDSVRQAILGYTASMRWLTQQTAQAFIPAPDARARLPQCEALRRALA